MSDKRFERWNDHSCKVKDNQEDTLLNWEDVVDLLNEQQATISALKEENEQLMIENAKLKNVITELKDMEKSIKSERFYIHCGDDINKQLMDTESDFNIHVEEIGSDEELIRLCNLLNKQQATISRLEEENDNMNLFIKQTIEPLLFNCVFELDTIGSMSQVELARKIENEIIPFIQDFKYLKYESLEEEKQDKSK